MIHGQRDNTYHQLTPFRESLKKMIKQNMFFKANKGFFMIPTQRSITQRWREGRGGGKRERERESEGGREGGRKGERRGIHSLEIVIIVDGECPRISDGCCHSALHLLLKVACWFQEEELPQPVHLILLMKHSVQKDI